MGRHRFHRMHPNSLANLRLGVEGNPHGRPTKTLQLVRAMAKEHKAYAIVTPSGETVDLRDVIWRRRDER